MIVIHCRDSCSTIVMMIVLFYYHDCSRPFSMNFYTVDYRVYFMQPMVSLIEHCNPDHLLAH